jgi:hypothetical protein
MIAITCDTSASVVLYYLKRLFEVQSDYLEVDGVG